MNLKELNFKKSYDSDRDDILNEFYIPALSVSTSYERISGFFSSTSLAIAARGIAGLIANGGKIRLICGAKLLKEDVEEIIEAKKGISDVIIRSAICELEDIENLEDKFIENHVKALGWMVRQGLLDIKVALVKDDKNRPLDYQEVLKSGIFHQKVGILRDIEGNIVSFSGSDNETASAWIQNIEEFKVFCSWGESQREYLESDIRKFEGFWDGLSNRTEVIDIPEAVRKRLLEIAPDDIGELELASLYIKKKGKMVRLWNHQIQALDKWLENGKRCIFEMATGTGKTLAALACLRHLLAEGNKLVTVITCPYSHLIYQWKESLSRLGICIDTVTAFSGNIGWRDIMTDRIRDVRNEFRNALVILTTHDTFYKNDFKEILSLANCKLFLIADEVHGLGSEMRKLGLTEIYDYRLGLSATPMRWFDPEGTRLILNYFQIKDETDLFIFSLEDAIKKINPETGETYLTPYEYKPYFTELTDKEIEEYLEMSHKIAAAYYSSGEDWEKEKYFDLLCFKRQKIIQNASKKYNVFKNILDDIRDIKHCLVYCSPEQIESVQEILNERQIIQHKFTQEEGTSPSKKYGGKSEREYILDNFARGTFQSLVAMKCLDEGVDIPQARTSIILASTGNPREYIQRRGRLLRHFPGKELAIIYDIIVFPTLDRQKKILGPLAELEKRMVLIELRRYEEFANTSLNVIECIRIIRDIEKKLN